jgi:hypothetical protein
MKTPVLTANVPQICGVAHLRSIYQSRASSLTDQTVVASARGTTRRATCSQGLHLPSKWDARRAALRRGVVRSDLSHTNVPSAAYCSRQKILSRFLCKRRAYRRFSPVLMCATVWKKAESSVGGAKEPWTPNSKLKTENRHHIAAVPWCRAAILLARYWLS